MSLFKIIACSAILLAACSNEDNSGKNSGPRNLEEGFKYLKSLNVSDARMIYRRETNERAAGVAADEGYWKIDLSGNETKLVIEDAQGQNHDIGIGKVVKLSERVLLIDPDVIQIMNLISPIGPDEEVTVPLFGYLSIVDVETEKLYRWPQELKRLLGPNYDWNFHTASDKAGNVYFTLDNPHFPPQIYKLDVENYTIQPLLPEELSLTDFRVTADGFLFFWHQYAGTYYMKCPAGNIVPLTGKGFCLDDKVYSVEDGAIYLWEPAGDNALSKKPICPADVIGEQTPLLQNGVRKTVVFECVNSETPQPDHFWAIEFNGTGFSAPFQLPVAYRDRNLVFDPDFPVTSRAWYLFNPGEKTLHKLLMQDYTERSIPIPEYEIQHLVTDCADPDLHFRGFRYSDGKNVIGTITQEDEIVIETVSDNGKLIDLISIN